MQALGMTALKAGRSFLPFTALALFISVILTGRAECDQIKHPVKPMLWKVEGKDLTKPSYLFGTLHLGSPEVVKLHPAAQKAFDGADAVYTEVVMHAKTRLAATQLFLRKDGKTLSESMGEELFAKFEEELKLVNPELDA